MDMATLNLPVIKKLISIVSIVPTILHEIAFIRLLTGLSALSLTLKPESRPFWLINTSSIIHFLIQTKNKSGSYMNEWQLYGSLMGIYAYKEICIK